MRFLVRISAILCLLCATADSVRAEAVYFMTVFGSQNPRPQAKRAHTFASVIKATGEGDDWNAYDLEVHSISWLPETLDIKVWRVWPEPGDNFGLYETLDWAVEGGDKIRKWGPFRICPVTYCRTLRRIRQLDEDEIEYQAVDPIFFRTHISNCIHAVSAIDPFDGRTRYPLIRVGFSASRHITEVFVENDLILATDEDHRWLDQRLGLDAYPIIDCQVRQHFLAAGLNRTRRRDPLDPTAHVPPTCKPDFVIPAGMDYCPKLRRSSGTEH